MIGFLIWNTGNATYPVLFVYAEGREQAKQEVRNYIIANASRVFNMYAPDNWTVEPVTREQDYPEKRMVIAPKVN